MKMNFLQRKASAPVRKTRRRGLRIESLENRRVLAGLVLVEFNPGNGLLTLTGDVNSNDILIRETSTQPGDSFEIVGRAGTRLSISPVDPRVETTTLPVTNVKDIVINFTQAGSDVIAFAGKSAGVRSELEGKLTIRTAGQSNVQLTDLALQDLLIEQTAAAPARRGLQNVTVNAPTILNSVGGETFVVIAGSQLDGGLTIVNGEGDDDFSITNTRIGGGVDRPAAAKDYLPNTLTINNGNGRTTTSIVGTPLLPTVIHGGAVLTNGVGFDMVTLQGIETTGGFVISNGNGDAAGGATVLIDSGAIIGSDMINGNGLVLTNGTRRDVLTIQGSQLPNGMLVNNSKADDAGNDIAITGSTIGGNTLYGNAVQIINGLGNDSVTVMGNSVLNGLVDIGLDEGNDTVMFANSRVNGVLNIGHTDFAGAFSNEFVANLPGFVEADSSAGKGRDRIVIENTTVTGGTFINLGDDADSLELLGTTRLMTLGILDGGGSFADVLTIRPGMTLSQSLPGFDTTTFATT